LPSKKGTPRQVWSNRLEREPFLRREKRKGFELLKENLAGLEDYRKGGKKNSTSGGDKKESSCARPS